MDWFVGGFIVGEIAFVVIVGAFVLLVKAREWLCGFRLCSECYSVTRHSGSYERGWRCMWLDGWSRPRWLCCSCSDKALHEHGMGR